MHHCYTLCSNESEWAFKISQSSKQNLLKRINCKIVWHHGSNHNHVALLHVSSSECRVCFLNELECEKLPMWNDELSKEESSAPDWKLRKRSEKCCTKFIINLVWWKWVEGLTEIHFKSIQRVDNVTSRQKLQTSLNHSLMYQRFNTLSSHIWESTLSILPKRNWLKRFILVIKLCWWKEIRNFTTDLIEEKNHNLHVACHVAVTYLKRPPGWGQSKLLFPFHLEHQASQRNEWMKHIKLVFLRCYYGKMRK